MLSVRKVAFSNTLRFSATQNLAVEESLADDGEVPEVGRAVQGVVGLVVHGGGLHTWYTRCQSPGVQDFLILGRMGA